MQENDECRSNEVHRWRTEWEREIERKRRNIEKKKRRKRNKKIKQLYTVNKKEEYGRYFEIDSEWKSLNWYAWEAIGTRLT